jgi:hypothetical protein
MRLIGLTSHSFLRTGNNLGLACFRIPENSGHKDNLDIKSIRITQADMDPETPSSVSEEDDARLFRVSDNSAKPYTAKVRIDYDINNEPFSSSDFIIINI